HSSVGNSCAEARPTAVTAAATKKPTKRRRDAPGKATAHKQANMTPANMTCAAVSGCPANTGIAKLRASRTRVTGVCCFQSTTIAKQTNGNQTALSAMAQARQTVMKAHAAHI